MKFLRYNKVMLLLEVSVILEMFDAINIMCYRNGKSE